MARDEAASRGLEGRVIKQVFESPNGPRVDLRKGGKWSLVVMLRGIQQIQHGSVGKVVGSQSIEGLLKHTL